MWRNFAAWLVRVTRLDQVLAGNPFERQTHEQLPDPFRAEVLLDGNVVALLSDRRAMDMFWYSYRIEPCDATATDDSLWERCRFTFRDPATGRECRSAFVGGRAPFIQDGRIMLRAMYFPVPGHGSSSFRDKDRSR